MTERIGRYELLKPIGRGGMAEVFLARQVGAAGFSKELVIKRVLPDLVGEQKFVTMFLDEARLAALLTHPNICQVFELGEVDGQYFIAMERVPGRTLSELLRVARDKKLEFSLSAALRIVAELCEALAYAHALKDASGQPLKLVHRDVTTTNVMVTPEGSVKLLDFGIARAATRTMRTQVGVTRGKLGFMAPEQVLAPQDIDHRADLFNVGMLLHMMVTGRAPYADVARGDLMREMAFGHFPPPRTVKPSLAPELEAIILKAMAVAASERYATAVELHRAVEKVAMQLGLSLGAHALRDFLHELDRDSSTAETHDLLSAVAGTGPESAAAPPKVPAPPLEKSEPVVTTDELDREAPTRVSGPQDGVGAARGSTAEVDLRDAEPPTTLMSKSGNNLVERTQVRTERVAVARPRKRGPLFFVVAALALVALGVAAGAALGVARRAAVAGAKAGSTPPAATPGE